jgi:hypothetical protein
MLKSVHPILDISTKLFKEKDFLLKNIDIHLMNSLVYNAVSGKEDGWLLLEGLQMSNSKEELLGREENIASIYKKHFNKKIENIEKINGFYELEIFGFNPEND